MGPGPFSLQCSHLEVRAPLRPAVRVPTFLYRLDAQDLPHIPFSFGLALTPHTSGGGSALGRAGAGLADRPRWPAQDPQSLGLEMSLWAWPVGV